jgi:hypothetical protein
LETSLRSFFMLFSPDGSEHFGSGDLVIRSKQR